VEEDDEGIAFLAIDTIPARLHEPVGQCGVALIEGVLFEELLHVGFLLGQGGQGKADQEDGGQRRRPLHRGTSARQQTEEAALAAPGTRR
jgi:hypothetical protein